LLLGRYQVRPRRARRLGHLRQRVPPVAERQRPPDRIGQPALPDPRRLHPRVSQLVVRQQHRVEGRPLVSADQPAESGLDKTKALKGGSELSHWHSFGKSLWRLAGKEPSRVQTMFLGPKRFIGIGAAAGAYPPGPKSPL
jgi:hypothetical protein